MILQLEDVAEEGGFATSLEDISGYLERGA